MFPKKPHLHSRGLFFPFFFKSVVYVYFLEICHLLEPWSLLSGAGSRLRRCHLLSGYGCLPGEAWQLSPAPHVLVLLTAPDLLWPQGLALVSPKFPRALQ